MNRARERAAKFKNLTDAYVSSAVHGTPAFVRMLPTDRCNLDFRFLDLDLARLRELRAVLKEKVAACNLDCYSNCAYDSYFYTHNKGEMLKKVWKRLQRKDRSSEKGQ